MTRGSPCIACAPVFVSQPRPLRAGSGRIAHGGQSSAANGAFAFGSARRPACGLGAPAAGARAGAERLVHDALDGPRAPPALRAAAEAAVDLAGRARREVRSGERAAHLVVAQYVAGTNDH